MIQGVGSEQGSAVAEPRVWVFGAGKGGVGTSTVVSALAVEAGLSGLRTLLIDGEPGLGGTHRLFGLLDGHVGFPALRDRGMDPDSVPISVSPNVSLVPSGGDDPASILTQGQRASVYGRLVNIFADYDLVLVDGGATLDTVMPALSINPSGLIAVESVENVSHGVPMSSGTPSRASVRSTVNPVLWPEREAM